MNLRTMTNWVTGDSRTVGSMIFVNICHPERRAVSRPRTSPWGTELIMLRATSITRGAHSHASEAAITGKQKRGLSLEVRGSDNG